jgi:hypothetical protein
MGKGTIYFPDFSFLMDYVSLFILVRKFLGMVLILKIVGPWLNFGPHNFTGGVFSF